MRQLNSVKKFGKNLAQHFMTGVSYMLPVVVSGGLLLSLAVIFGGQEAMNGADNIWGDIASIGKIALGLVVPIIAAYISYSIADKPGLGPAFVGGMIANELGTGFLGGMFVGIVAGYFVLLLKQIKLPSKIASINAMIIIPLIGSLVIGLLTLYVIGEPIAALNTGLTNWLQTMSSGNTILLSVILGAMMAIDMGGPINKVANTFGIAAFTEGIYTVSTPMWIAVAIPPTGMFLATLIGKKLYSKEEIDMGRTAMIMGIAGITEGTIPFAVADPLTVIPSIVVGTSVTSGLVGALGVTHNVNMATYFAIPFANNIFLYILCIAIGSLVVAIMVNFLKSLKYRKRNNNGLSEAN